MILALDIGTSSVRAALYDLAGNLIPETMVKNERAFATTVDGGAEIDADAAVKQVVAAVDKVLIKSQHLDDTIEYAAACSFWHSLVGIDAWGKPTTKLLGWADTRSHKYVSQLRRQFDEAEVHNRTGARFHPSYWPAKLMWLRKEQPQTFERTVRWLSFSDYLTLKLSGFASTSISMASGTGIFDQRKCVWDDQLLRSLKLKPSQLPRIAEQSGTFSLKRIFAKRWPRLANARWFPAIGDGAANNVGSGCVTTSKAALMIGTSGAMRIAYKGGPPEKIPPGLWCYRIGRDRAIIGGALSDGGGLYRWLKVNLKLGISDEQIAAEIARREPAGHGLVFLPFLFGERSTGYHEYAQGAIAGLRSSTDAIDIVQAALESVAYRFAEIFEQLEQVFKIREIVASGAALHGSPVWTQIIADVLRINLSMTDVREVSCSGAVWFALETIGKIGNIDEIMIAETRELAFSKSRHEVYKKARKRHERYYLSLIAEEAFEEIVMS